MFTLELKPLFWWPVTCEIPSAEKIGEFDLHTFEMQFELVGRDESRAVLADKGSEDGNDELMKRVSKGWRNVVDGQGQPIAFSEATFAAAWQQSWFRIAVNRAYTAALIGEKARLGN